MRQEPSKSPSGSSLPLQWAGAAAKKRPVRGWGTSLRIAKAMLIGWTALCGVPSCMAPTMSVSLPVLSATPNPSTDGAYTVAWNAIGGASKYQLYENGELSYRGVAPSQAYAGKPAGSYTYSLTYCVVALGIEACNIPSGLPSVTVKVSAP